MTKIIRTKSKAHGGITPDEKRRMDEPAQLWIARAMRTEPIEPDKIIPAIEGLYEVAGLKKPRVVIVPSPVRLLRSGIGERTPPTPPPPPTPPSATPAPKS